MILKNDYIIYSTMQYILLVYIDRKVLLLNFLWLSLSDISRIIQYLLKITPNQIRSKFPNKRLQLWFLWIHTGIMLREFVLS